MTTPPMLDFVKAMSEPDRLRIIGSLVRGPRTAAQISRDISLPFRKTFHHLAFLSEIGIVLVHAAEKRQEELYELDSKYLEHLAREQFEGSRTVYVPSPDEAEKTRRVLAAHLNADGTISQIPLQGAKLRILLDYLINVFEPGRIYTEKEVNALLKRFHADYTGLRRDLIDAGLLERERDGSRYWREAAAEQEGTK